MMTVSDTPDPFVSRLVGTQHRVGLDVALEHHTRIGHCAL
jgi:hypothetical protein